MKTTSILMTLFIVALFYTTTFGDYTQKWQTPLDGGYFFAAGNTDADANSEILVGNSDTLFLIDGVSGNIEWFYTSSNTGIYTGVGGGSYSAYGSDLGPQLVDVDADGVLEIVFYTGYSFPTLPAFHCFDSDVVVGVTDDSATVLPNSFQLKQNFPNPFNPSTVISYTVPKRSHVTLTIYNLLGQEVTTLVDEEKSAGEYEVTWNGKGTDGEDLASGVYFYALQTNQHEDSRKMMLLK